MFMLKYMCILLLIGCIVDACVYNCLNGNTPAPNPNHELSTNGCGTKGMTVNIPDFVPCCTEHDYCYGTCNAEKTVCDKTFETCLKLQCGSKKGFAKHMCHMAANTMVGAVETFGCPAYRAAQEGACLCT